MRLNIREIINRPGESIEFAERMDLSGEAFHGTCPATQPVSVTGAVRNSAGMLSLRLNMETVLSCVCDRCGALFKKPFSYTLDRMLADELEEGENDEILLLEDGMLDVSELVRETFILNMDTKLLCREDCRGLCPGCGVNLNVEECRCKREPDPRWAALKKLLEE